MELDAVETTDDYIEYVMDLIGSDFEKALRIANDIAADPSKHTGPQAAMAAQRIAVHRYRIGIAAQHWKVQATKTKKESDRRIKDALISAYTSLEEVINTLKLTARSEVSLAVGK